MKNKKLVRNIILVAIIFATLITFVAQNLTTEMLNDILNNLNTEYLIIVGFVLVGFYLFHFLSLHNVLRIYTKKIKVFDSFNIANCVHFYNGITPFSAGGQPFQIYYYNKRGLEAHTSTSVIIVNFIIYQLVVLVLSVLSMVLFWDNLSKLIPGFSYVLLAGFIANTVIFISLLAFCKYKFFNKLLFNFFFGMLKKIKFLTKTVDKLEVKAHRFIDDFQIAVREIKGQYHKLIFTFIFRTIAIILLFTVPYFVFNILNISLDITDLLVIIGFAAFAHIFYTWIPLPGSSGGAEFAFYSLFITIGPISVLPNVEYVMLLSLLIWRVLAYYVSLIFGFVSTMFLENYKESEV